MLVAKRGDVMTTLTQPRCPCVHSKSAPILPRISPKSAPDLRNTLSARTHWSGLISPRLLHAKLRTANAIDIRLPIQDGEIVQ